MQNRKPNPVTLTSVYELEERFGTMLFLFFCLAGFAYFTLDVDLSCDTVVKIALGAIIAFIGGICIAPMLPMWERVRSPDEVESEQILPR